MSKRPIKPTLNNPLDPPEKVEFNIPGEIARATGPYEEAMKEGCDLIQRPDPLGRHRPDREAARQEAHDGLGAHAGALRQGRPSSSSRTGARTSTAPRWSPRCSTSAAATWRSTATTSRCAPARWTPPTATSWPGSSAWPASRGIPLIGMNDSAGAFVPGRRGRPRRLRRGLHGAAQDQRRGPLHHVHVRLQRRRRLLPAAPGQLRHPAQRHLLRPDRPGRGEVGAGRGHHPRGAGRPQGARQLRRGRPHRAGRAGGAAPGGAAARLHPRQQLA